MCTFADLHRLWKKFGKKPRPYSKVVKSNLCIESLEGRLVPYSASGNTWPHPELVTLSFVPDGTNLGGTSSNLQKTFDNHANSSFRANWRKEVLRAAQVWAQQTNLNFALISDNGADSGSGLYQQGDPGFGDIRIGGRGLASTTLASAYLPPPVNNYSIAGDFDFNTTQTFNLNSTYDLFTVATHEFGHGLGLLHSTTSTAVMYGYYNAIKSSLRTDDINGIRNSYSANLGRSQDSYDAAAANGGFATATALTTQSDLTALVQNLDITTTSDLDYYAVVAPAETNGTMRVKIQSNGLSLLAPLVKVYDANQVQIGSVSGLNQYGATLNLTINNVTAGQRFYVMVDGADNTAFGTGKYALALNFGANPTPNVPLPNTQTLNGNSLSGGGGLATHVDYETRVNSVTDGLQTSPAVAMDADGNQVVVWMSDGQDGDGWGVYAHRFNAAGAPQGDEFRVNTTTEGDQKAPTVARDGSGNFVVTWVSNEQDDDDWDVCVQRFNDLGEPQGGEFRVNTTSATEQHAPAVAMNNAGEFVITWSDSAQDGSGSGIWAQEYSNAGTPLASAFRVTTTANAQNAPATAVDGAGNFVVAWASNGEDGSDWGIHAQRFEHAGGLLGSEFRINTHTADVQKDPAVAMNSVGDFVITWSSKNQAGDDLGVYGQRYNAIGVPQGTLLQVSTKRTHAQKDHAVVMDDSGGFMVTWSSYDQGADKSAGIYARQYDRNGLSLDQEFRVNSTTDGDQQHPAIALNNYGNVVIVWDGNGFGDASGIFAQRYAIHGGEGISDGLSTADIVDGCGKGCTSPAFHAASAMTASVPPLAASADEPELTYDRNIALVTALLSGRKREMAVDAHVMDFGDALMKDN